VVFPFIGFVDVADRIPLTETWDRYKTFVFAYVELIIIDNINIINIINVGLRKKSNFIIN